MSNKLSRIRRTQNAPKIAELGVKRLVVYKSNCHIYAQIIDESGAKVFSFCINS